MAACIALDLFPRHQGPEFRYTGSDPARAVWHLGWPLALAIYDRQHGFFVSPIAYLVVPLQLGLLGLASLVVLFLRWQSNPSRSTAGANLGKR